MLIAVGGGVQYWSSIGGLFRLIALPEAQGQSCVWIGTDNAARPVPIHLPNPPRSLMLGSMAL